MIIFLLFILFSLYAMPGIDASNLSTSITIGGHSTDNATYFMFKWAPLFEGYLTSAVGSQMQPPITFNLIPVGYTASTGALDLFMAGELDLVCERPFHALLFERGPCSKVGQTRVICVCFLSRIFALPPYSPPPSPHLLRFDPPSPSPRRLPPAAPSSPPSPLPAHCMCRTRSTAASRPRSARRRRWRTTTLISPRRSTRP